MPPQPPNKGKFFQVNFGYRALMDWTKTGMWLRPGQDTDPVAGEQRRIARLKGPIPFSESGGGRPSESQRREKPKIPGYKGFYYDVMQFARPNLASTPIKGVSPSTTGDKDLDVQEVMNELGDHAQQWLYLAAEKMAARGAQLESSGKVEREELERIRMLLNRYRFPPDYKQQVGQPGRDEWYDVMEKAYEFIGAHGEVGQDEEVVKNVDRFLGQKRAEDVLMGTSLAIGAGLGGLGEGYKGKKVKGKGKEVQTAGFRSGATPTIPGLLETKPTAGDKQFRAMLVGVDKQWINSFAQRVFERGNPGEIRRLAKTVEDNVKKYAQEGKISGPMAYRRIGGAGGGSEAAMTLEKGGAGSTVQEWALSRIRAGRGKSGEPILDLDYMENIKNRLGMLSNLIDTKFRETVKYGQAQNYKAQRQFQRVDLTTSFFRTVDHHGTGRFKGSKWSTTEDDTPLLDRIRSFYGERIQKYNHLINMIMKATGKKSLFEARQAAGGESKWASVLSGQVYKKKRTVGGSDKQQTGFYEAMVRKLATEGIDYVSTTALLKDIEWMMHHMGNMLPGQGGTQPYANVMPIDIEGTVQTLVFVAVLEADGRYKQMGPTGSYVYLEEMLPLEWLHKVAQSQGYQGSFANFAIGGNESMVAAALVGVGKTGQLCALASSAPASVKQTISMAKISTPAVSARLEAVTDELFASLTEDFTKGLRNQIHDDAVKFSVLARNPEMNLSQVYKWWQFGVNFLLTREAIDAKYKRYGLGHVPPIAEAESIWEEAGVHRSYRRDPFWYLWAAPYVSARYTRRGGSARQGYVTDVP
tara:strand:+ start:1032 stop:3461 length:2430 start_codon:yes stop_codon:yes gene_type:complete